MDYETLNKDALLVLIKNKDNEIEKLENKIEQLEENIEELDEQLRELEIQNGIKDTDNFIWELKKNNLYTEELNTFINNYLKFYN